MAEFTPREYSDMCLLYAECDYNAAAARRLWIQRFPLRRVPTEPTIRSAVARFQETGNAMPDHANAGRPRDVRLEAHDDVENYFLQNPRNSTRDAATALDYSQSTVHTILKKDLRWRPYHYTRVQGDLTEQDRQARVTFCRWLLNRHAEDPQFIENILWTDESLFGRCDSWNQHNKHHWADENPHNIVANRVVQHRFTINVWMGIIGDQVVGPHIFGGTLNGRRYQVFLNFLLPQYLQRDVPHINQQAIWFQQDGAPAHWALPVRRLLNNRYGDRWIGRDGPITWPPRSPDLNPLDFFLWGFLKDEMYTHEIPADRDVLRNRLHAARNNVTPEMLQRVRANLIRRAECCLAVNGGHFEQLLRHQR